MVCRNAGFATTVLIWGTLSSIPIYTVSNLPHNESKGNNPQLALLWNHVCASEPEFPRYHLVPPLHGYLVNIHIRAKSESESPHYHHPHHQGQRQNPVRCPRMVGLQTGSCVLTTSPVYWYCLYMAIWSEQK